MYQNVIKKCAFPLETDHVYLQMFWYGLLYYFISNEKLYLSNAVIFVSCPKLFADLKICSLLDVAKKFPKTSQVILKELIKPFIYFIRENSVPK